MADVSLHIDDQIFKVNKDILCEQSDYFRAMFSGNYVENEQDTISIDVVDATSMKIIISFMEIGFIDLSEFSMSTIGDLAMAVNFLQIPVLIKQIEYTLELQLSLSNWIETVTIAENASYSKLEKLAIAFGLLSFKNMQPKYVTSIHKLVWYLSHRHLHAGSELEVFKFGFDWITNTETGADALLMILGCLDYKKLTLNDLLKIQQIMSDHVNSLAAKVVECLIKLSRAGCEFCTSTIVSQKKELSEMSTERVYNEVLALVKDSRTRVMSLIPSVPVLAAKDDLVPHMYTFSEQNRFEKWLEVAEKDLWGWSITSWGPMRLVVVCGEHGRGTGSFMRDVKVYDTLKKVWTQHGVQLPPRRHAGLAVVRDSLFIVGGVGGFRVVLDTALIYDLKQRCYRKIAKFPDAIQSPAVCLHDDKVYAAGHNTIYRYEDYGDTDEWVNVTEPRIWMSCMMSFKGYVYCTQSYFSNLYRFQPGNEKFTVIKNCFKNPPIAICDLGNRLIFFTRAVCGDSDILAVAQLTETAKKKKPKILWTWNSVDMKVYDVAGSCSLVMTLPPIDRDVSQYLRRYLARYADQL